MGLPDVLTSAKSLQKQAMVGEMKQKDRELERLLQEYAMNYADAKSKYTDTLAKVQVSIIYLTRCQILTSRRPPLQQ